MSQSSLQEIMEAIVSKYESLETPNFSFVMKAYDRKPYDALVQELGEAFELEEDTDLNDDVSFGYMMSSLGGEWGLELSMVSKYAVVFRIHEHGGPELMCTPHSEGEENLLALLDKYEFEVLTQQTLELPIALKLQNTDMENTCYYQALFSDTDILPWQS